MPFWLSGSHFLILLQEVAPLQALSGNKTSHPWLRLPSPSSSVGICIRIHQHLHTLYAFFVDSKICSIRWYVKGRWYVSWIFHWIRFHNTLGCWAVVVVCGLWIRFHNTLGCWAVDVVWGLWSFVNGQRQGYEAASTKRQDSGAGPHSSWWGH